MSARRGAASLLLLLSLPLCRAHQLDGYLQAATISVGGTRVWAYLRLTPGVRTSRPIAASIDLDGDGAVSASEEGTYAARVLRDVSISIDGKRLKPRLLSRRFPALGAMAGGVGTIELALDAALPPGVVRRRLVFENRH